MCQAVRALHDETQEEMETDECRAEIGSQLVIYKRTPGDDTHSNVEQPCRAASVRGIRWRSELPVHASASNIILGAHHMQHSDLINCPNLKR